MATYETTFNDIKYLSGNSGNTFSDGTSETALIKRLINASNKKNGSMASAQVIDATITTIANTPQYTLPSDFSHMVDMYYLQGTRRVSIDNLTEDMFLALENLLSNAMQFLYYTIRKTTISTVPTKQVWLYPIPSGVTTIYYRYTALQTDLNTDPSATTNNTANLIAESGFENLDVYYVLYHLFSMREQPQQALTWKNEYDKRWKEYRAYIANYNTDLVVKTGVQTSINPNLYPVLS